MSKKVNHAAPKSAKINPASDATNPEKKAPQAIPSPTSDAKPVDDYRTELVKKAQAAKNAAAVGLIPQEQADALWAQAVEACKPSPEAIALAKSAKTKKDDAEKVLKAAQSAHKVGLVTEAVVKEKLAIADAAKAAYTEAAKAACKRKVQSAKCKDYYDGKTLCVLRFDLCAEYPHRDHELGIASRHQKGRQSPI